MHSGKRIQISRRSFLRRASATAAATGLPLWFVKKQLAHADEQVKELSANDRPNFALIGSGNMGTGDARNAKNFGKPLPDDAIRLYQSNDHRKNWFECMASRKDPICPVEVGHRSATVCHLGAISLRTGKSLQWDPEKELFTGEHAEEANSHVVREMRKPYDYSFVGWA